MTAPSRPCLEGRVAIVTGANSGIGRGIAEALAREGAKVAVGGRRDARNREVAEAIVREGGEALPIVADMTCEADIVRLVAATIEAYGRLDICVANAGGVPTASVRDIVDMEFADWRETLALNLDAVFLLYREALRHMLPARRGVLIGVSSAASIRSTGSAFHYSAAKAGVNALTMNLAEYLGPQGVRINTIVPGFIEAESTASYLAVAKVRAGIERRIPMRRIGLPADVGELAIFLASDRSSFITGQDFVIDGDRRGAWCPMRRPIEPPAQSIGRRCTAGQVSQCLPRSCS